MIPLVDTWPGMGQPGKTPVSHAEGDPEGVPEADTAEVATAVPPGPLAGVQAARIMARASVALTLQPGSRARARVYGVTWGRPAGRGRVRAMRGTG